MQKLKSLTCLPTRQEISNIIEYGLYLLIFLLPIQTRLILRAGEINGGYLEYLTISLYGVDIILFLLLVLFVIYKFRISNFEFRIIKYWYIIGILDVVIFVSIFFATDKWLALYRYGLFLLGIGLFWLVVSANYSRIKLLWSLLAGLTLQAGLGIWQFLTQSSFASKWLGLAMHEPTELGVSVVELITKDGFGERWLRAYGGLDHPNVLGGALVIGILLVVGLITYYCHSERSEESQVKREYVANINKIFFSTNLRSFTTFRMTNHFLWFVVIVFVAALFFSFSRTAWLALVIGIIIMLSLAVIKKNWQAQREILTIILIFSFLIFGLYSQFGDLVKTRFFGETRLEVKSSSERMEYISEAKELISQNWLFGAGIGNYSLAAKELDDNQADDESGKNYFFEARKQAWGFQPVHNVFLLVWAEVGIVGLLGFLGLLGYLGFLSWQRFWREDDLVSLPLLLALVIIMMFDHWLWSLHFGVLFFWLVMGLVFKKNVSHKLKL